MSRHYTRSTCAASIPVFTDARPAIFCYNCSTGCNFGRILRAAGRARERQARWKTGRLAAQQRILLTVEGMSCAGCVHTVETALTKLPGVASAAVNLATGEAAVVFDPARQTPAQLVEAVRSAGYSAREATEAAAEPDEQKSRARAPTRTRPHGARLGADRSGHGADDPPHDRPRGDAAPRLGRAAAGSRSWRFRCWRSPVRRPMSGA